MHKVNVYGYDGDLDIAGPGDVWLDGGVYPFPTAAAATTIVSASANDDGDPAGTGARTVKVHGLDDDLRRISETVTLNGTGAVTLTNEYKRINLIEVLTAGSGGVPAGRIDVKHGATIIGSLEAGMNRSRMAIFTCPENVRNWRVKSIRGAILDATVGAVEFTIYTKKSDGVKQPRLTFAVYGTGNASHDITIPADIALDGGEDVWLYAATTADNAIISGGFDLEGSSAPL